MIQPDRPGNQQDYLTRLMIKESKRIFFLLVEDIQHVEADGNYLWVHAGDRRHLLSESISSLEPRLPSAQFIRINRSYIINQYAIQEMEAYFNEFNVKLTNGIVLRWSRSYRDRLGQLTGWSH